MKILYTADIHARHTHLSAMLQTAEKERVDCIIIGGDIVPHTLPDTSRVGSIKAQANYLRDVFIPAIRDFKRKNEVPIYCDLGNDDFISARKILENNEGEGIRLIHLSNHQLSDSVDILGYMNVPITPFSRKDWEKPDSRERPYNPANPVTLQGYISSNGVLEETLLDPTSYDTIENDLTRLEEMIKRPFLFVSHSPPYDTPLDVLYNGLHVGSLSIRRFIEKWSEKGLLIASFHGHIHESPNRSGFIHTKIGNTLCFNPGQGYGNDAVFCYIIFVLSEDAILLDG